MKIILASASKERAALLRSAGFRFEVYKSHIDETLVTGKSLPPAEVARALAAQKAVAAFAQHPHDVVMGADTLVCIDGVIFGQPKNREDAKRMLRTLSGTFHEVYTGVHFCGDYIELSFSERTVVEFYELSEREIDRYLDIEGDEYLRHPGAYSVNGPSSIFIERINGDINNCKGLPIGLTVRKLRDCGFRI
ncbi:MAG: Maf family nucleotide pyrophosphatase [Oscillospiraceae bacterium]|jgi:septum formation protein|nr:Maf family nucleotide pyrophosphatase [Oscillospiraceae bacterium]